MSFTPYNAPFLSGLLGDPETVALFSIKAELAAMLRFEAALAKSQARYDLIPKAAAKAIGEAAKSFRPNIEALNASCATDGLVVPEFVRQLRKHIGEPHAKYVHFGATSQDVIDTSFMLRFKDLSTILESRLVELIAALEALKARDGCNTLMARTRMQAALPIKAEDRIASWAEPLPGYLTSVTPMLQLGGPVGTLSQMGDMAPEIRIDMAQKLGLFAPEKSWHSERRVIADMAQWMCLITGTLGKMGQDIALLAQNEIAEISLDGGGGSSAMAHKKNPVKAEALVTLARFNAVQISAIHQSMVHEQERSGAAWTLEWMIMPQICVACGAALRTALTLVSEIKQLGRAV
ncbi:MAG: 3-carboxy-cis,cis-muconate cycloisomerase [Hyphomicrobiales bacterium]|nr:MAG: 3-carboxy-cis,cis-muconate cycloisomerase [Hyphomicrobiales bacterium]